MLSRSFNEPLTAESEAVLAERARIARGHSLTATSVAGSGHPGGSMSSMEIYTLLYSLANLRPEEPRWEGRDRIVISHGHTSPGAYAALAGAGFFPADELTAHFRQAGSVFEGHVERAVPGIEWSSGNLGQGLAAGVGFALGARMTNAAWHTFVVMSDGEQQKGQVGEARRLAVKERLAGLTVVVDWNHIQISGRTDDVMPVPIAADWEADGWRVLECDGHDLRAMHAAIADALGDNMPTAILAHTVIGRGVGFMEGVAEFHGRGLTSEEYPVAMADLGLDPSALDEARARRTQPCAVAALPHQTPPIAVVEGPRRIVPSGEKADCRGAWGKALVDIGTANPELPVAVFDCDLAGSVKTDAFLAMRPDGFIECGVGEHTAATASGALSTVPGVLAFWADFGVFGLDEVYNQQRLNDINGAGLKLALTHCGLDVGEDGKTHQCVDYVGLLRNLPGFRLVVAADANQTDAAVRSMAAMQGNVALVMGRSKLPVILGADDSPLFGERYKFRYGEIVWARDGTDVCILAMGTPAGAAVAASDVLRTEGVSASVGVVSSPLCLHDEAMRRAIGARALLTVEDHLACSGLGASVAEWLVENRASAPLTRLGVVGYQSSGASSELLARARLDSVGIADAARQALQAC